MKSEDAVVSIPDVDDTKKQLSTSPINPGTISIGSPTKDTDFSSVTNAEFISAVFPQVPSDAFEAICSKPGDPTEGGWPAARADLATFPPGNNNYISF